MEKKDQLIFLGTAGARFVVARQLRSSGGLFLQAGGRKIIIDPGPGTLVRCAEKNSTAATELETVILTHAHIDHSSDVNVIIDAMTGGGLNKRGELFAPADCLEGENAVILEYLRSFLDRITLLEESKDYQCGSLNFSTSIRHNHGVETYGLQFDLQGLKLSLMVDTRFLPALIDDYRDSDLLVINTVIKDPPTVDRVKHLSIPDVCRIVRAIRPQCVILTHFGMSILRAGPDALASQLTVDLGVRVLAAEDGMEIDLSDII